MLLSVDGDPPIPAKALRLMYSYWAPKVTRP
jgi:hypothetical protein